MRCNVGLGFALVSLVGLLAMGCQSSAEPAAGMTPEQAQALKTLTDTIVQAPTAKAEGRAMLDFRAYAESNGYTYVLRASDLAQGREVDTPAKYPDKVRVYLAIRHGKRLARDLVFIPKDNTNLDLLAPAS
jgi:hypothetical protein